MTHESGSTSGDERPDQPPPPSPWGPPPAPSPYGQAPGQPPVSPPGAYGVPPSGGHPVPYGQPAYHQNVYGYGYPPGIQRDPDARPGTVLAAAITTFVATGLTLLAFLAGLVGLLVAGDELAREVSGGFTGTTSGAGTVYAVILLVMLVFVVWCVIALVMGVFVLKRRNWARITLTVSAAVSGLLSLVSITSGITIVTLGAAVATIVCLFTGGASDWFHREHLYSPPRPPQV